MRIFSRILQLGLVAIGATAAAQVTEPVVNNPSSLREYGPAPELTSTAFLNTDVPMRLEALRGQVVLLEFWTFDCINCINTLPHVQAWHTEYAERGLNVIGVHFPEFHYERDFQNVRAAVERLGVTYPIAFDNDGSTWRAYNQRYWPTIYLIDKRGIIRYIRIGEGAYDITETAIESLLAEELVGADTAPESTPEIAEVRQPAYLALKPADIVNVRSGPGTDFSIVGSVSPDMAFVVLEETNGWYRIGYNDGSGYVIADYVEVTPVY